jgi:hypothetical protein
MLSVAWSASMFDLYEDNGQNTTLAASMFPPLLVTEVKPAAAERAAEGVPDMGTGLEVKVLRGARW